MLIPFLDRLAGDPCCGTSPTFSWSLGRMKLSGLMVSKQGFPEPFERVPLLGFTNAQPIDAGLDLQGEMVLGPGDGARGQELDFIAMRCAPKPG